MKRRGILGLLLILALAEYLQLTGQRQDAIQFISFIVQHPQSGQELIGWTHKLLENSWFSYVSDEAEPSNKTTTYEEMVAYAFDLLQQ